jgi:hypothetical protein
LFLITYAIEIAIGIIIAQGTAVLKMGFLNPSNPYLPLTVDVQQIKFLRCG